MFSTYPSPHRQMGGAGTLVLVEFPTRQEKEQRKRGGSGGGGQEGGRDQRIRFTMEYEAKKGKKVGGSLRGTGLRNFPEAGVERGADKEVAKAPEGPSVSFGRI